MILWRYLRLIIVLTLAILLLGGSVSPPTNQLERIRSFTRPVEFDYVSWTLNALAVKLSQYALGTVNYIPEEQHRVLKLEYLDLVWNIQRAEAGLRDIYSDPNIDDPEAASAGLRQQLDEYYLHREQLAPLAESILQKQVAAITAEMGLAVGGQPIPPVLYHSTPLPLALIISPREVIREDHHISLDPDLTVDQQTHLEDQIDAELNVSSLVVPVGGIGMYPTMVMQISEINSLAEIVAHEWVHNYLTLRPLGLNYLTSPELRTMNETAAAIAGKEIGYLLVASYYPELLLPPDTTPQTPSRPGEPPVFNFRAEMNITRVTVDEMLEQGRVEEAEAYMEQRRRFFWDNDYHIRKLNQAYFAFYGAYADLPGGAAGEDPVGAAVRALRQNSPSLAHFLNTISWMSSFEQLQQVLTQQQS